MYIKWKTLDINWNDGCSTDHEKGTDWYCQASIFEIYDFFLGDILNYSVDKVKMWICIDWDAESNLLGTRFDHYKCIPHGNISLLLLKIKCTYFRSMKVSWTSLHLHDTMDIERYCSTQVFQNIRHRHISRN